MLLCRMDTLIQTLAPTEVPLLICGETGTGKEVLARRVHALSGRKGPFVGVNCGAISEHLAESELFGHEAGSFTGATARREGWFEAAQTGTLFLDEVGDLPVVLQVKLLRAIQEKEIARVGSRKSVTVNVRIIAATSVDLEQAILAGQFRRDLYYRLSGGVFRLPALRERSEDILPLAGQFLSRLAAAEGRAVPQLTEAARAKLLKHRWPGNIRELENVIQLAFLTRTDGSVDAEDLRIHMLPGAPAQTRSTGEIVLARQDGKPHGDALLEGMRGLLHEMFMHSADSLFSDLERLIVTEAFAFARQNQVHSAALLGLSRNVLRTLLKRHGLIMREPEVPSIRHQATIEQQAFC
jgi:DNA-binding NtrC family response regulator